MEVTIRGQAWRIVRATMRRAFGYCHFDKNLITISRDISGQKELEILIHEVTHAAYPDLAEHPVHEFAHDCAAILHQAGFRKVHEWQTLE